MIRRILPVLLIAGGLAACQTAEPPLTDADRAEIETAVRAVFQTMVDGMNEHDADKILSAYSRGILYTGDGAFREGWEAFERQVRSAHDPAEAHTWSARIDETRVKVLSRDFAIVTAWGVSGDNLERGYTVTDLLQLTPGGWLIINEHESEGDPPGEG